MIYKKTRAIILSFLFALGFLKVCYGIPGLQDVYIYLNYIEDVKTAAATARMLENQARQVKAQVDSIKQNFVSLKNYEWRDLAQSLQQVDQISEEGKALSYSMKNIDSQFKQRFPDFNNSSGTKLDFSKTYDTWKTTTLDTIQKSFKSIGVNTGDLKDETRLVNKLKTQGQTAKGRMQIMQTSTEIAAENLNQMQKLQRTIAAQANAQNTYMAKNVSEEAYEDAVVNNMIEKMKVEPKDHSKMAKELWDFEAFGRKME